MSWADNVNGLYESVGGIFMLMNCFRLYKDKQVKGVSLIPTAFFCSWGYWNLYYYPSLNQWASTWGAALMTLVNTVWIVQAIYYTMRVKETPKTIPPSAPCSFGCVDAKTGEYLEGYMVGGKMKYRKPRK